MIERYACFPWLYDLFLFNLYNPEPLKSPFSLYYLHKQGHQQILFIFIITQDIISKGKKPLYIIFKQSEGRSSCRRLGCYEIIVVSTKPVRFPNLPPRRKGFNFKAKINSSFAWTSITHYAAAVYMLTNDKCHKNLIDLAPLRIWHLL